MARTRWLTATLLATSLVVAPACGDSGGGNGNGQPDTGRDTGGDTGDGGGDTGTDANNDTGVLPPTGESLTIGFVTHTRAPTPDEPEEWHLLVTDEDCDDWPERCDVTEVMGGSFTCERECQLSPNGDFVLWIDPATAGDLLVAPVDGSLAVSTNVRTLAQNIEVFQVGPELVVYLRGGNLFAQPLAGGAERDLGLINSQDGRNLPGGFHYAPHIDRVLVNVPTSLSAMDLIEINVNDPGDRRLLYHFVADVEQTTGSFYQGQMDISVSPDGRLVALFTKALDNANPCTPDAGRSTCDDEYVCSSNSNRCIGEQLVLHTINRDEAGLLSTPGNANACTADGECGQYHLCDRSVPDNPVCAPGKRIIGPFGRFACQMDAGGGPYLDPGEYDDVIGNPMWREDGRIVFVGSNDCAGTDIDVTNLVAIDPGLQQMETIVENPGGNQGGPSCYDDVEQEFTPEGCNVEISRARMSPSGQSIVFIASSVRSATDSEVWLVDAWGRGGKDDLTRDILTEIEEVQILNP